MNDSSLQFDRTCHVLYSRACKKQIKSKIALYYPPEQREAVWTQVQLKYVGFISGWRTDLGGKSNFHNGPGGNYDCVALMAYYTVCKEVTGLAEIEEMESELFLPAEVQRHMFFEFGSKENHFKYRDAVMKAYPYGNYPVFDGFDHMQYQIRDPKGFAEMLDSVIEKNAIPRLDFLLE